MDNKNKETVDGMELYELCVRKDWFTCGTVRQYHRMFDLNENGASIEELALIIWLCSEDMSRSEVENELKAIKTV